MTAESKPRRKPRGDGEPSAFWTTIKSTGVILLASLALLWGLEIVDTLVGNRLDQFGILPRRIIGLRGILFAPFLHGGFAHLSANSGVFIVFGGLILLRSRKEFFLVTAAGTLLGGLGVWLFGSLFTLGNAVHIGASGVIFTYFGYLLFMGIFERKIGSILLSVVLAVAYGGVVPGVMPGQEGVSWESHLFGFLTGILCARFVGRRARAKESAADAALTA